MTYLIKTHLNLKLVHNSINYFSGVYQDSLEPEASELRIEDRWRNVGFCVWLDTSPSLVWDQEYYKNNILLRIIIIKGRSLEYIVELSTWIGKLNFLKISLLNWFINYSLIAINIPERILSKIWQNDSKVYLVDLTGK